MGIFSALQKSSCHSFFFSSGMRCLSSSVNVLYIGAVANRYRLTLSLVLLSTLGFLHVVHAHERLNNTEIRAFLLQMRCAHSGALPGDATCGTLTFPAEDADPGYRLSNGVTGAQRIESLNVGVTRNNKWRVVSPDLHVAATDPSQAGGVSIAGIGEHYISILGSWSPVAESFFVSEKCPSMPDDSTRFLDAWVLGPVTSSSLTSGSGITYSNNLSRTRGEGCPESYHAAAFTWQYQPFTYTSGRRLKSLISVHYSAADSAGTPGIAEQRERIYLARGIGMARWEKWSRDDWQDKRNGRSAADEARAVYASKRCNRPVDDTETDNNVRFGPVIEHDFYAQQIQTASTQPPHLWYLTKCEDYTYLVPGPTTELLDAVRGAPDIFWQ